MKKLLLAVSAAVAILTLVFAAGVFAATGGITVFLNGKKISLAGFVEDGKVMVSLEELANSLGGTFSWNSENKTATVNLPVNELLGDGAKDSYSININKVMPGVILTVSGEVTNISNDKASFFVYGKLFDANDQELTKTKWETVKPVELAPGETGTFEIYFYDYDKFKDIAKRYTVEAFKFTL